MTQTNSLATIPANHAIVAQAAELAFTPEQEQMIRDSFANGASQNEFAMLMGIAKARRLNPLLRQIHFVKRWDSQKQRDVWAVQVAIDGMRAIAERTGKYDGQDEPEYEYDGKQLLLARVKVYRKDWSRPAVGVARFSEYAQRKRDGSLTQMWAEKAHIMIAKCAEALALRKAFPEDTSGLYVAEEMPEQERRQQIAPHIGPHETGDELPAEDSPFDDLQSRLLTLETRIDGMLVPGASPEWQAVLDTRFELGSGQRMSQLLRDVQTATEANRLVPNERKVLSAAWQRINRKLCKVEKTVKRPDVTASFSDPPEGEEQPEPVVKFAELGDGYIEPRDRRREPGEEG